MDRGPCLSLVRTASETAARATSTTSGSSGSRQHQKQRQQTAEGQQLKQKQKQLGQLQVAPELLEPRQIRVGLLCVGQSCVGSKELVLWLIIGVVCKEHEVDENDDDPCSVLG